MALAEVCSLQSTILVVAVVGRAAATEVGVLQDVLAVAREKRYLVLDPVNNDMPEQRPVPVLLMLARKKVYLSDLHDNGIIQVFLFRSFKQCSDASWKVLEFFLENSRT